MYPPITLAFNYLNYYLRAANSRGHGTHSPFVYEFIEQVLNDRRDFYPFSAIENRRKSLKADDRIISFLDLGKTPSMEKDLQVAGIAGRSLSSPKFGRLLFRLADHYQPQHIIELGTSLGISGAYLASGNARATMTTIEGSPAVAAIAGETFRALGLNHIKQYTGHFDELLSDVIAGEPPAGLIYIDGNHRKEALLRYFKLFMQKKAEQAVFILHDIHWSREMEEGWKIICDDPDVMLTIDLFSAGLVFFRDQFRIKQHFTIRF